MTGARAERFVVLNLRLLAVSFAVVGILFIAVPNGVLDVICDLGDALGSFTRAPGDGREVLAGARLRLHGGDHRDLRGRADRRGPLPAAAAWCSRRARRPRRWRRSASTSSTSDVFIYLLNFLVDGFLAVVALSCGRSPAGSESPPRRPEGARRGWAPPSAGSCAPSSQAMAPGVDGLAGGRRASRAAGDPSRTSAPSTPSSRRSTRYLASLPHAQRQAGEARALGARVAALPVALQPRQPRRAGRTSCAELEGSSLPLAARPAALPQGARRARLRQRRAGARRGRLRDALRGRRWHAAAGRRPSGPGRPAARPRAARSATWRSSARAPAARSPRRSSPRPASTSWCSRRARTWTAAPIPRSRWRRCARSTATAA